MNCVVYSAHVCMYAIILYTECVFFKYYTCNIYGYYNT